MKPLIGGVLARTAEPDRLPMRSTRAGGGLFGSTDGAPPAELSDATRTGSTLFSIVDTIATSVAKVEWHLYLKTKSGDDEDRGDPVTDHAAWIMWDQPNPFFTGAEFRTLVQKHRELTGEGWPVVRRLGKIPAEIWAPRPDRMTPVVDGQEYVKGYIYTTPDGEKVPLELPDVLPMLRHNPNDPYRGLGPVQALLTDLDSAKLAAQWNRNFFRNSAEPGGIVEIDTHFSDPEWAEFTQRWRNQHQGVSNAHRVAVLERGAKWVNRSYSMKDMQFTELRKLNRDVLLEAFSMNKFMIGANDDVNRAASLAADTDFSKRIVIPRVDAWKALANGPFLRMFAGGERYEFDYVSPVEPDTESANDERDSKINGFKTLLEAGVEPDTAARIVGLPEMEMREVITVTDPAPAVDPVEPAAPAPTELDALDRATVIQRTYLAKGVTMTYAEVRRELLRAGIEVDPDAPDPKDASAEEPASDDEQDDTSDEGADPADVPAELEVEPEADAPLETIDNGMASGITRPDKPRGALDPENDPDAWDYSLDHVQDDWNAALTALLRDWATFTAAHKADLIEQIKGIIESGDIADLSGLGVDSSDDADALLDALVDMAAKGADQVKGEAETQGVQIDAETPKRSDLKPIAVLTAALLAAELALSAGREAARVWTQGQDANDVGDAVKKFLDGLTDARPTEMLGGALTGAQNAGRIETFQRAKPEAALYANEVLDSNTCSNCRAIHGRWIGNAKDEQTTAEVRKLYPNSGYIDCLGRDRCRGTITGVWRPEIVGGDDE